MKWVGAHGLPPELDPRTVTWLSFPLVAAGLAIIGVLVGVLLSGIFFAGKIAQLLRVTSEISAVGRVRTYRVEGQLFSGSVEDFMPPHALTAAKDRGPGGGVRLAPAMASGRVPQPPLPSRQSR